MIAGMRFHTEYLTFRTKNHREYINITPQVEAALVKSWGCMGRNGLGAPCCFVAPTGVLSRVEGVSISQPRSGDIIETGV